MSEMEDKINEVISATNNYITLFNGEFNNPPFTTIRRKLFLEYIEESIKLNPHLDGDTLKSCIKKGFNSSLFKYGYESHITMDSIIAQISLFITWPTRKRILKND